MHLPVPNLPEVGRQKEVYTVGYEETTADFFRHRRAATHAAFFLPRVRQGMTLLDCGCGPGTITLDFATIVSPADVVGIDLEPSQMRLAQQQAAQQGIGNSHFAVANLYALPFPDGAFDAVFLHGVLEHMQAPVVALCEVHRVLKRGGVVGARHADFGGFLLEPAQPPLDQFAALFEQLMRHHGADPKAGRHQPRWFREAGFDRIVVSASYDCWTQTPEETRRTASFLARLISASAFATQLLEAGLADRERLASMSQSFTEWGMQAHAFAAEAWGEAVAWKT